MIPQDNPSSKHGLRTILYRMVRSARLDSAMFRSLREDSGANGQSVVALALAGLSFGIGFTASVGYDLYTVLLGGVVGIGLGFLIGFVWLSLTYLVVTRLFKGASSFWGLGRPVFFASSPGLVFLLMLIPASPIPDAARDAGLAWIALANVFAIKNAMGFNNERSFITFIIVAFVLLVGYGLVVSL
jgi:Yip1-like protein